MIDPSIWQDEGMAELTPRQQLLYIGLFSNADDDGRIKGSPAALRLALPTVYPGTPLDEVAHDVAAVLNAFRQLVRYEADGRIYIVFRNYRQWQRIDKPSPSILPPPPEEPDGSPSPPRMIVEPSQNDPVAVPPSRREVKLTEEKGIEERVVEEKPRAITRRKVTLLERSEEEAAVLTALVKVQGFPPDLGDETTEKLREYADDFSDVNLLEVAKELRDKGGKVKNGWLTYRNWLSAKRQRNARPSSNVLTLIGKDRDRYDAANSVLARRGYGPA